MVHCAQQGISRCGIRARSTRNTLTRPVGTVPAGKELTCRQNKEKGSTIMLRKTSFILAASAACTAASAQSDVFNITIENLSPNVFTPAPFIAHNSSFDLFTAGKPTSSALEMLAENGITDGVTALAMAAGSDVTSFGVAGNAPIGPGGSAMVELKTDSAHGWLSFASMLAFSNDAFIGGAFGDGAINLYDNGRPFRGEIILFGSDVWDAGTEVNDELAAHVPALGGGGGVAEGHVLFRPHGGILGVGDIPLDRNWGRGQVARITIVPAPAGAAALMAGGLLTMVRRRRN